MAGKSPKRLKADEELGGIVVRCVEKALQPTIDLMVMKSLDARLKTLLQGSVDDLLLRLDLGKMKSVAEQVQEAKDNVDALVGQTEEPAPTVLPDTDVAAIEDMGDLK